MLLDAKDISNWELRNEINKVNVRWTILILTLPYLYTQFFIRHSIFSDFVNDSDFIYVTLVASVTVFFNFIYNVILFRIRKKGLFLHASMKYISMISDLAIVTLLLPPTGGSNSMFFLLYIIVLLSNGMRYGMRLAVVGILVFNCMYLFMLLLQFYPDTEISDLSSEVLKVIGVWITGLYIGYLARRFQFLHDEVDKYKNLLKKHLEQEKNGNSTI